MVFNSFVFILIFLPLAVAGYFWLNKTNHFDAAKFFLLGMSLWFFGYVNVAYVPLLLLGILVNWGVGLLLHRRRAGLEGSLLLKGATPHEDAAGPDESTAHEDAAGPVESTAHEGAAGPVESTAHDRYAAQKISKLWFSRALLLLGIFYNLGLLVYFKYWGFFMENINAALQTDIFVQKLLLPLGISFLTFQHIAYLVDAYRGTAPRYSLLDYALYTSFFPKVSSGPIALHDEMIPQFSDPSRKRFDYENFSKGLMAFSFGLAKKVLLADVFGIVADWGFTNIAVIGTTNALIAMLAYTLQIYFDFSGYCDMATGICRMLNIELPMNFDSPYRSKSVGEFWDKWHITLTRFFRRYIYFPLGGNRKGRARTYLNMMIIFLISGLWHGANWTFLLWGAAHGIGIILSKLLRGKLNRTPGWLKWFVTFLFVNLAWVYFRSDSVFMGNQFMLALISHNFIPVNINMLYDFCTAEMNVVLTVMEAFTSNYNLLFGAQIVMLVLFFAFGIFAAVRMKNTNERIRDFKPDKKTRIITAFLLIWSILSMSGVSSFLYVNF